MSGGGSWEAMTTAERLDRIALAAELAEVSERFMIEAGMCRWTAEADRCIAVSYDLARHARVLDDLTLTPDLAKARGLVEAATVVLGQLEGARRFLRSIVAVDDYVTASERQR